MTDSISERRMVENEVFFRQRNKTILKGRRALKVMAKEDGQDDLLDSDDEPLHFFCECSDENCRKRIQVRPSKYDQIHSRKRRFVIACGHEVPDIEKIVERSPEFCVAEKFLLPPASAAKLNPTPADNT